MNPNSNVKIDPATSRLMDALRGVSALVVAFVHAYQVFVLPYFGIGSPTHLLSSMLATHAVVVFFIVSGFMIYVSVVRHRRADGGFDSRNFAEARIIRIYPPLIAALVVTIAVYLTIHLLDLHGSGSFRLGGELFVARERVILEWSALLSTFFLLYGAVPFVPPPLSMDGPLWTLSYEWWFYILAYLSGRLWNGLSFSTLFPLAAVIVLLIFGRNTLFLWFFLIWLSGFCLAHLYVNGKLFADKFWQKIAILALALLTTMLMLGRWRVINDILNPYDTPSAQKILVVVGMLFTLVISLFVRRAATSNLLIPGLATNLAGFSYTLYVIHYPLLLLSFSFLHPLLHNHGWKLSLMVAMAVVVPIAYVSSKLARLVENRILLRNFVAARGWSKGVTNGEAK